MTLDKAYTQLLDSEKFSKLIEAGYKCEKCKYCEGTGRVWDRNAAVYNGSPHKGYVECRYCSGEGRIWISPIIKHSKKPLQSK